MKTVIETSHSNVPFEGTNSEVTLMDRQIALEEEMLIVGRENFYKSIEDAKERGEEAGTAYGLRLMRTLLVPMKEAIEGFVEEAANGGAGRRNTAVTYVALVEPEVTAYLTLKTVLDSITKRETLQRAAIRAATALEDEVRLRAFRDKNPEKFKVTMKKVEAATSRRYKQNVSRLMANRAGVEVEWPTSDKVHLGTKLIELLRSATGLVDIERVTLGPKDTQVFVVATEATLKWIDNANERMEILAPAYLPTIVPPKPWTTPFDGGYWSGLVQRLPLVKTRNQNYLEELSNRDLSAVYSAVNAMQDTPWRVNGRVLQVLKEAWERPIAHEKLHLPSMEQKPLPRKPDDIATNEAARKAWKKEASRIHQENAKLKSKRIQLRKIIQLADQFSEYEEIFFPYQLDFRGRVYAVPMFLNPQGPDHAKALLTFARGKRIGNGVAAGWLAIHGANTYGYDKVSLDERIAWVEERNALIASVAADPWGEGLDFWTSADKPWQFLAFCFEWAGFLQEGYDFVSSLPIALDGSCNGLQHYSAALRDPVGGAAVNLLPSDKPQDIYGRVAEVTLELVKAFACPNGSSKGTIMGLDKLRKTWTEHGIDEVDMANRWLAFGIDRKITKRSVMTLPYGSTQYSCREFLEEAVREKLAGGKANVFANGELDGIFKATLWLQPLVWQAIGEVVKAARVGMDWLKECARLAAAEGLPVTWETPDGFFVQQSYYDSSARRIKTCLDGQLVYLTVREERPDIDKRRQAQGIAPNWVHSMDATAMRMFINLAVDNGIQHFALIHDSYGTVAADVEMMSACLKKAFVRLYTDWDPLTEFRVDIAAMLSDEVVEELPPVPAKGTLDISQVEESDFFFA